MKLLDFGLAKWIEPAAPAAKWPRNDTCHPPHSKSAHHQPASACTPATPCPVRQGRLRSPHSFGVTAVVVTPDGRRAVSASVDHTLNVWDLGSGLVIATFTCDAAVYCVSVGTQTIAAGDAAGRIHFLSLQE